jgi:hypothetical protein
MMSALKRAAIGAALALAAPAAAQSGGDEPRYFHCSYRVGAESFWTAVGTTLPYGAMVDQWKAFAQGKGGTSAFCFSSYRKDDPAYQSLEEVEAIGKLAAGAKRVDWTPPGPKPSPVRPDGPVPARLANPPATAPEVAPPADSPEYAAAMKRYNDGLAAHDAAVAQYKSDLERQAAENAAAARAVQEETARRQAAYQAELERNRALQAEYEAKMQALRKR